MIRSDLSRRHLVFGLAVTGVFGLAACSGKSEAGQQTSGLSGDGAAAQPIMTVYRDPNCPCCEDWVRIAEREGFSVRMIEDPDMPARKQALGVPAQLASCHTAQLAGLVFEGHVPIAHLKRLVADGGPFIGLAVPGMPRGSPGMEMPDGAKDPFDVIGFDRNGRTEVFARG